MVTEEMERSDPRIRRLAFAKDRRRTTTDEHAYVFRARRIPLVSAFRFLSALILWALFRLCFGIFFFRADRISCLGPLHDAFLVSIRYALSPYSGRGPCWSLVFSIVPLIFFVLSYTVHFLFLV
ncbi:hypothetical protein K438DRAFT_836072 [Mycena galopus ATCC 62051]|nr:hypothetical protein K438DRAFT_836072 [Mycena galopus ATCC 62051]